MLRLVVQNYITILPYVTVKKISALKHYLFFSLLFLLACLFPTNYGINSSLVTTSLLLSSQSTILTIYQTRALCLVQEYYPVNFKAGTNYIQFSLPQTADKESLQLTVLKNFDKAHVRETVLSPFSDQVLWKVEASQHLETELEIAYFIKGISWDINYDIDVDKSREKIIRFSGWVNIENKNEQNFTKAKIILVTGAPHVLPEEIKKEDRYLERVQTLSMDETRPPEIIKEAISEYYMYQIEGSRELKGQAKASFELFSSWHLPYQLTYHFNFNQWGVFPRAIYEFKNPQTFPLPAGPIRFWLLSGEARVDYLGQSKFEYAAQGEKIELSIAENKGLKLERKMTAFSRAGLEFGSKKNLIKYYEEEAYKVGISNFLEKEVSVKITENITGEWRFVDSSIPIARREVNVLEFELQVPPVEEKHFTYQVQKIFRLH